MPHQIPLVSATNAAAEPDLRDLERRMAEYYNRPGITTYFDTAHSFNTNWCADSDHWAIRQAAAPGMRVLDLGCGSGHSFLNLRDRQVQYTGLDISQSQVARNIQAYGDGPRFLAASLYDTGLASAGYDLVFSTYVLEHLVFPQKFLAEAARLTTPGGLLILLCPHFRPHGRIPSFRYGKRVRTLRQRIRAGDVMGVLRHIYLRNYKYPRLLRSQFPPDLFPFLIHLQPTCLQGDYYPDNDAVYLTDRSEILCELTRLGMEDQSRAVLAAAGRPGDGNDPLFIAVRKRLVTHTDLT